MRRRGRPPRRATRLERVAAAYLGTRIIRTDFKGPLHGWKIVDLSRVLGGPYYTQFWGDLGARIIKVEPPQGDETRDWGPPFKDGQGAYFRGVNRNKQSVGLDLSKPWGREVLLCLLEDADASIENFKSGSMEKWNLGYHEVLKLRFSLLIHCHITGFGPDGPFGWLPGATVPWRKPCASLSASTAMNGPGPRISRFSQIEIGRAHV